VQSAKVLDGVVARPEVKVVSVRQNDLRPDFFKLVLRHGLNRRRRAHRHERRSFHSAMSSPEQARPGRGGRVAGNDLELDSHSLQSNP
jgi:hypothetical protein